jgi:hypothetical protein
MEIFMKTFKEYLKEQELPEEIKYVAIICDQSTQTKLINYCIKNNFNLEKSYDDEQQSPEDFEFHVTIFFTNSLHKIENKEEQLNDVISANPIKLEVFGQNKDVPVLKVEGDGISKLRKYFEKTYNMTDEWPDFKPHISLSYDRKPYNVDEIELPDFPIYFDKLVIRSGEE